MLYHFLQAFLVNNPIIPIIISLSIMYRFSPAALKSLSLFFNSLIMMCLMVYFFGFTSMRFTELLNQIFGDFSHNFFKYFFCIALSSLGTPVKWILDFCFCPTHHWGSAYIFFFSLLPLFCIHWIISINLSSSSLTPSSYLNSYHACPFNFCYYYSYWLFSVLKFLSSSLYLLFLF